MTLLESLDIALYLRKSREDVEQEQDAEVKGKKYDTLAKHRTELLSFARRNDHNIIDIFEEVVSGQFIGERPEIQKLLMNVKNMKYDAVLVMDIDRLGRGDKVDQGRIERAFKESHTVILTPSDVIDMNRDSDEEKMEFKTFISRMEYRQIRKRLQGGRIRSAKDGKDVGQKAPYGYEKGPDKRLVIREDEACVVRLIFQWCIEGVGRVQTARRLTEMMIPNPSGLSIWSHVTVRKILGNPKYKGDQVFGRVKWMKQEDGTYKTKVVKDVNQLHIKEGAHEPIVLPEVWEQAQKAIERRVRAPVRQNLTMINPFSTILRCKKCGNAILANNPKNKPSIYLYCDTPGCQQKMSTLARVEEVVLFQLESIMSNFKTNNKHRAKKKNEHQSIVEHAMKRIEKIKEEIEKAQTRKANLHDLLEDGTYTKEVFLERMKLAQEKIKELEIELQEVERKTAQETSMSNKVERIIPNMIKAIAAYKKATTAEEKNTMLKSFIKEIRYNREKHWTKPHQFEIEIELYE